MEDKKEHFNSTSASILTLGIGWFPQTPGGLERYIYELTHNLAANQDQIELCGVGLPETELNVPIKLTNLADPDQRIWQRMGSIRHKFKKTRVSKPDAINLHFALYSFPILDLLPKGVPITFNFHGPWAAETQEETVNNQVSLFLKRRLIEQSTYNRCDRFIVLSKAFGNILHQQYQIPWSRIHIIPGGVNLQWFQANLSRQAARKQLDWPENRRILFTSRRLVQRVGIDKLLQALAIIKPQVPDVWLAIAGRGHLQATLQKQVKELGLEDNVKFLGFLPDAQLPLAYQAAELTVMPSQSFEGFGLAIIESLACGTPVLCTPIGGMPEILASFSPDLITTSAEASAIAEKLAQILLGNLSIPVREICREYAVNNFDWQQIAQKVRHVLLA
ncbi:glycosyltransferase family 4 protein [Nodularia spumigena CS-584]|uniref:GDP-mannose-dependent alpha-(1-6)-phosphatidylinositol monomannoside mannosyltransferase n=4 Tax=Nodularia spumigena TaxID=70799 RepID=A0A2S0QAJ2_NODSP|nr:glycosyltransferase family 4 protein [Nodularia spumigena]AHJ30496.1 Glycosyltransferase [Nodularia spumigena CCY9414]AVZ31340.1 GDP-mannose-dependent alpha-(1-6)-phosphatidylinositol monomannoside mannosyltransferase [Nodularia spumigena UHCC 0039]MDB9383780.1 glycosyltransferase family 4 protein [Nodularia spumigena CS-584]MEA5524426.1 glycosyltransferase family 4 protein [Nodularia spumigena UHCC 0143]MEA5555865.1 glycosyltransferase family 4 protein [Nodularia spumigena CH309]